MMNIMHFYEAGKTRSGTALVPVINADSVRLFFTTRNGNAVVKWGDGTETNWTPQKNIDYTDGNIDRPYASKSYSLNYSGDISVVFKQGLKDVYSFASWISGTGSSKVLNIQNFGTFIKQFPNLHSIYFLEYAYQTAANKSTIKGNLADVPNSVERIMIREFEVKDATNGNVWFDLSTFTAQSQLKYFNFSGGTFGYIADTNLKLIGDLSKLPTGCSYFNFFKCLAGSAITYTAGKVWASSFDTLSISLALSHTEIDNLLIDMDNSITTKTGAGVIYVLGYRTSTSDAAVASLQAKGFTVNIQKYSITPQKILDLDFQNNFTDTSSSALTMVAGGTSNQPTFALSGRKAGEYCAVFNGSKSIKTTTNLPVNSDKVTIAFWMKTTQTATAIVGEMSPTTNSNNTFSWYINDTVANSLQFNSRNTGSNQSARTGANNGTWKHFVAVIDRAQNAANEILIYENGVLTTFTKPASTDNNGNFVNNILYIGQRAGSSLGFNGMITRLKMANYPFTPSEVTNLYNSEV